MSLSISLKERLTFHNVESCLQHIRERLETSPEISNLSSPTLQLCPYMFPPENSVSAVSVTILSLSLSLSLKSTLEITRNFLESEKFVVFLFEFFSI